MAGGYIIHSSNNNEILFTIVTIVYNDVENIEDTIVSVLSQTYKSIEYIVVDGNSTDGTLNIIQKFRNKISHFISESDNGIYDAMNKGIELASGKYIHFMNCGDRFSSKNILNIISKTIHEDIDFIYGDAYFVFPDKIEERKAGPLDDVWKGMPFSHQSLFVKTSIMSNYKFNLKYKSAADYDFVIYLCNNSFSYQCINQPICYYSMDGLSSLNQVQSIKECLRVLKSHNIKEPYKKHWLKLLINVYLNKIIKRFRK